LSGDTAPERDWDIGGEVPPSRWTVEWRIALQASALPVYFSPVADVHHQDPETLVVDLIEDAIITDTNPSSVSTAEFLDAMGSGFIGQSADGTG